MISFNIASIESRSNELVKTIDSIIDQVDIVNICLNNYTINPYIHQKVNVVFADNEHGDAGKFLFLDRTEGYYLTGDDDLIYPPNYVKDMIKEIDKHGIVTHHGRSFDTFPITNYYHSATKRYRCLNDNLELTTVQFGGTGVMGFNTKHFNPPFDIFKRSNMADIWIGLYADKMDKKIWVLPHNEDYFVYQHVQDTIWEEKHLNDEYETKVVNDYFLPQQL